MDIFVIHKSDDYEIVKKLINKVKSDVELEQSKSNSKELVNFLLLENGDKRWKQDAKRKIKESDCILVALGENTHKSKYIDFEINLAKKFKKKIFLIQVAGENCKVNETLYFQDKFMKVKHHKKMKGNKYPLFQVIQANKLIKIIKNGYDFDLKEKINNYKNYDKLIEQYKSYLTTSEEVVNRRQTTSSFYIGINTTLVTGIATISSLLLGLSNLDYKILIAAVTSIVISILGGILCKNWISLLDSYGKLNGAKMKVVSIIEKELPYNLYDVEWNVMSEKIGNEKYCSFTNIEKRVPLIFIALYGLIIVGAIVLAVLSILHIKNII